MRIFISWSGDRSEKMAVALKVFLEGVIPGSRAWVSSLSVNAGAQWMAELSKGLDGSDFGVLCLTKEGLNSLWMAFEAGALMKSFGQGGVCPYLMDVQISHLQLPLSLFQSVSSDKSGTMRLVRGVASGLPPDRQIEEAKLRKYFGAFWPALRKALDQVRAEGGPPSPMDLLHQQIAAQASKIDLQASKIDLQASKIKALADLVKTLVNQFAEVLQENN